MGVPSDSLTAAPNALQPLIIFKCHGLGRAPFHSQFRDCWGQGLFCPGDVSPCGRSGSEVTIESPLHLTKHFCCDSTTACQDSPCHASLLECSRRMTPDASSEEIHVSSLVQADWARNLDLCRAYLSLQGGLQLQRACALPSTCVCGRAAPEGGWDRLCSLCVFSSHNFAWLVTAASELCAREAR